MPLRINQHNGLQLTSYTNLEKFVLVENLPYAKRNNATEDMIRNQLDPDKYDNLEAVLQATQATGAEFRNRVKSMMRLRIMSAEGANITHTLEQGVLNGVYEKLFRIVMNVPRKSTKTVSLGAWNTIERLLKRLQNEPTERNGIPNLAWTDEITDSEKARIVEHTPIVQQFVQSMLGLSGPETRIVGVSTPDNCRIIPALRIIVPEPPGSESWLAPSEEIRQVPRPFEEIEDGEGTEDKDT